MASTDDEIEGAKNRRARLELKLGRATPTERRQILRQIGETVEQERQARESGTDSKS